jgi:hypothetical protein
MEKIKTTRKIYSLILLVSFVFILASFASASPILNVTKIVSPENITQGDPAIITFNLQGVGSSGLTRSNLEVMLLIDRSTTMAFCLDGYYIWPDDDIYYCPYGDSQSKMQSAKNSASLFIDQLNSYMDKVGLIGFSYGPAEEGNMEGYYAHVYENLTSDHLKVKNTLASLSNKIPGSVLTNTGDAILNGNLQLNSSDNKNAKKVEILLSDGRPTSFDENMPDPEEYAYAQAQIAKDNGIVIYTISLGDADQTFMNKIAYTTGGKHYYATTSNTAEDLNKIFLEIAMELTNLTASNVKIIDTLPVGVELNETSLPSYCRYNLSTREVICDLSQKIYLNDNINISFDIIPRDSNLTYVNQETVINYTDYNGVNQTIIFGVEGEYKQPKVIIENMPPIFDTLTDKSVDEESLLSFIVSAKDPGNDPINLSVENLPTDANFTDNGDGTGNFTWTPSNTQGGNSYTINFSASDDKNATSTIIVIITVRDLNPGISNTGGGGGGGSLYCSTTWTCSEWFDCINGTQTRACTYPSNLCKPSTQPINSRACSVLTSEEITSPASSPENQTTPSNPGRLASITGAVVGVLGNKNLWWILIIILLLTAITIYLLKKRASKKK